MIGHHVHRKRSQQNTFCGDSPHIVPAEYGDKVTAPLRKTESQAEGSQTNQKVEEHALVFDQSLSISISGDPVPVFSLLNAATLVKH